MLPVNRYILLSDCQATPKEECMTAKPSPVVLLPEEYQASKRLSNVKEYGEYKVLGVSNDCIGNYPVGSRIVVEEHMVKTINIMGKPVKFVLENYVICLVDVDSVPSSKKVLRG